MFFNQYPYLNVNDLNLDYILKAIADMKIEVKDFVSINAIKYADPIQWDITKQYEKNTVVIDPLTGTAYISVAPVPAGVALTRPEYWTVVFDLGSFVTKAAQNFTSHYESETTTTATFNSNTNDWLVWGDVLYKALVNITAGDTYVVGSNIDHFTIEDLYNAYLNTVASILGMIGDLDNLATIDKTSLVNAINEVMATSSHTYDNVAAMIADTKLTNGDYVKTNGYYTVGDNGGAFYSISNTPSGYYETLTNGLYAILMPVNDTVTIQMFGVIDSSTDVSSVINTAQGVAHNILIVGTFLISNDISDLRANLIGVASNSTLTLDSATIYLHDGYSGLIENVHFVNNGTGYAIIAFHMYNGAKLTHLRITSSTGHGIKITRSWYFEVSDVVMTFDNATSIGLLIENYTTGGVNSSAFNNISINGGLHSIVFDRYDSGVSNVSEGLQFNSCALEHAAGAAVLVNYAEGVAATSFNNCYFEHNNENNTDSISTINRSCAAASSNKITVSDCVVRTSSTSPLFGDNIIASNIKKSTNGQLFINNSLGCSIVGGGATADLPTRWATWSYEQLIDHIVSPVEVLKHKYNQARIRKNFVSGSNTVTVDLGSLNSPQVGFVDLFIGFVPNGYDYNYIMLRLNYSTAGSTKRCDYTVVDKYETYSNAFNELTIATSINTDDNAKLIVTLTSTRTSFIGGYECIVFEGYDFNYMNGNALSLS